MSYRRQFAILQNSMRNCITILLKVSRNLLIICAEWAFQKNVLLCSQIIAHKETSKTAQTKNI